MGEIKISDKSLRHLFLLNRTIFIGQNRFRAQHSNGGQQEEDEIKLLNSVSIGNDSAGRLKQCLELLESEMQRPKRDPREPVVNLIACGSSSNGPRVLPIPSVSEIKLSISFIRFKHICSASRVMHLQESSIQNMISYKSCGFHHDKCISDRIF